MNTSKSDKMGLRAYQMKARQDIHAGFQELRPPARRAANRGGKTILFSRLAQDFQPKRTLILAHREELIAQAVDKLRGGHRDRGAGRDGR